MYDKYDKYDKYGRLNAWGEPINNCYDRWGRPKSPYVKHKDLYSEVINEIKRTHLNKQSEDTDEPVEIIKTISRRHLLTRRVA